MVNIYSSFPKVSRDKHSLVSQEEPLNCPRRNSFYMEVLMYWFKEMHMSNKILIGLTRLQTLSPGESMHVAFVAGE